MLYLYNMTKEEIEQAIIKIEQGLEFFSQNPESDDCGWIEFSLDIALPSLKEDLEKINNK